MKNSSAFKETEDEFEFEDEDDDGNDCERRRAPGLPLIAGIELRRVTPFFAPIIFELELVLVLDPTP